MSLRPQAVARPSRCGSAPKRETKPNCTTSRGYPVDAVLVDYASKVELMSEEEYRICFKLVAKHG